MDNRIQSGSAYDKNYQLDTPDNDNPRLEQLASTPGLIDSAEQLGMAEDEGLRPEDVLEVGQTQPLPPVNNVAGPEVGPPIVRGAEDIVMPLAGRAPAVVLQEYLRDQLNSDRREAFDAAAEALGVADPAAFEDSVRNGSALSTFAQVDSDRIQFTDQNFNAVSSDQLSAVAKAQLVITGAEVPIDPKVTAPEVVKVDPNRKVLDQLNTPLVQNAELMQDLLQRDPNQVQQADSTPVVG